MLTDCCFLLFTEGDASFYWHAHRVFWAMSFFTCEGSVSDARDTQVYWGRNKMVLSLLWESVYQRKLPRYAFWQQAHGSVRGMIICLSATVCILSLIWFSISCWTALFWICHPKRPAEDSSLHWPHHVSHRGRRKKLSIYRVTVLSFLIILEKKK